MERKAPHATRQNTTGLDNSARKPGPQDSHIDMGKISPDPALWQRFLALPLLTKSEKLEYLSDSIDEALREILDRTPELIISYSHHTTRRAGTA